MTVTAAIADALRDRYVLERELGRGGMATVYLARDLRHDRFVALKVILPELAATLGPERFLGEIRITAHLQHPNLLPLFDSGEAAGLLYYTMPYVEGESLRQRLAREHQLPVSDAVRIAVAVAGALDYAHRHGVLHRDLKPENILLADQQPVVTDFGIALAVSKAGGARITQTGLSLGTPQYMSPEQATGDRELDPRTDVYSLGATLYEMLTGDPPHTGSTVQAVVAKVLTEKPRSLRLIRDTVPEHVEAVIERALAKLPADRWPTASQFAAALHDASGDTAPKARSSSGTRIVIDRKPSRLKAMRVLLPWVLLGLVGTALALREWSRSDTSPSPGAAVRFALAIPDAERMVEFQLGPFSVSPDGRALAYVGRSGGGSMLYVRSLGELRSKPLSGTERAQTPFFSADGRWIAFVVPGGPLGIKLKKVPADGGGVLHIADIPVEGVAARVGPGFVGAGGAWGADGTIVLGSERGLFRVAAGGGVPRRITSVDTARGEGIHVEPRFLSDGRTVVFGVVNRRIFKGFFLATASLDDTTHTRLLDDGASPVGMVENRLIFGRGDGTLAIVPLDIRRRRTIGEPVTVLDSVPGLFGNASLSENGTLVHLRGSPLSQLALVDARGNQVEESNDRRQYDFPRISPDGRHIAVGIGDRTIGGSDIWIYDLASKVLSRLTSSGEAFRPEWTPDGRRIAYLNSGTQEDAWWAPADGSGPPEKIFRLPGVRISELIFTPSGDSAVLRVDDPRTARDIVLLPLVGDSAARRTRPLVNTPANEIQPAISPDSRWLAYSSDETGQLEVYLRPFARQGGRIQVSSSGGSEPAWSPDGKRLYYREAGRFMVASLSTSPTLEPISREALFEDRYRMGLFRSRIAVHPDGKHFMVLRPAVGSQEIVVVLDWWREVRKHLAGTARTIPYP